MRKKPQEFGFGVRDVQATPVDTFSPEVVMRPTPSRGAATGAALSSLSQTLAGVAQQNKQFDDKTLEPLAQAVYAMRADGKSEAQIQKEVAESGITTSRVLKRIRKHGGFDAFTDPAFRLSYDELEGVGRAQDAETSMAAFDATAENMLAGIGIEDDRDAVVAEVEAAYREILRGASDGLSPFALSAFTPRTERSLTNRMNQAYGKAQRVQEQHAASLVVAEFQGGFDQFLNGQLDGGELGSFLEGVWKTRKDALSPLDLPRMSQSSIEAARAYLDSAKDILNKNDPEDAADIDEFLTAFEDSFPADVLEDFPDIGTSLRELRADFTLTKTEARAFRERDKNSEVMSGAETAVAAWTNGERFGAVRGDSDSMDAAARNAMSLFHQVDDMGLQERRELSNELGLTDPSQLKTALLGFSEIYETRGSRARQKRQQQISFERASTLFEQGQERQASTLRVQEETKAATGIISRLNMAEGLTQLDDEFSASQGELLNLPEELQDQVFTTYRNLKANPQGRKQVLQIGAPVGAELVAKILERDRSVVAGDDGPVFASNVSDARALSLRNLVDRELQLLASEILSDEKFAENVMDPTIYSDRIAAELEPRVEEALLQREMYGTGGLPAVDDITGVPRPVGWVVDGGSVSRENITATSSALAAEAFPDSSGMQKRYGNGVKEAYETRDNLRGLPGFTAEGLTGSLGREGRDALNSYIESTEALVSLYQGTPEESQAAIDAWRLISRDSGMLSMLRNEMVGALDTVIQNLEGVSGEAESLYRKDAVEHLKTLREMSARVSTRTSGKEEAMSIKFQEFQPGGAFSGILTDQQQINPDFKRVFEGPDGPVTYTRETVYTEVREHLRRNAGMDNPTDAFIREFIIRQAYQPPKLQ